MNALFRAIREDAPARVWSQGVKLVRSDAVRGESEDDSEVVVRVAVPGRAVAHTVVLYLEDEEWECDCPSSADTCAHVAAAIIALAQAVKDG
ncbi:MAG: SWIM zinc finger family protein, partial [Myxococcota bacterium]